MKKIKRNIAVFLILVMLTGLFTGCFTMAAWDTGGELMILVIFPPLIPLLDIVTAPIQIIILIVELAQNQHLSDKAREMDRIDSFSANMSLIPQEELLFLTEKLNSMPETEIAVLTETVASFSETEISAIETAFNNLDDADIILSLETLNSMPDEIFIAAVNNLRHIEFRF